MGTLTITAFLLVASAVCTVADVKNVTITKCCKFDEYLSNENKCVRSNDLTWVLRVYDSDKETYVSPPNTVPKNWILKENFKPSCLRPALLAPTLGSYVPFLNGSLYVVEYDELVHPQSYCIDYRSVLICLNEKTEPMPYVQVKKCCGSNGILTVTNNSCIWLRDSSYKIDIGSDKTWLNGFPHCEENSFVITGKLHEAEMLSNGSLRLHERKTLVPPGNYCLEHVLENAGGSASIITCQEVREPIVTVEEAMDNDIRFTIYPIGLALGAVFLAATLAASAILPASHHVLHWRCQMHHVICLLIGNVLLCITQLVGKMDHTPCSFLAISMHFLFLAAFFWLNTMCFNIWWTFRDLRPQSVEKSQERLRLRLYELYAWGVPFVIAGTAAILDNVEGSGFLKPRFGERSCWFYDTMEVFTFFYGPIGILLVINWILFAMTARELTCGLWKRELVKSTSERAALGRVCMKLVVVMGVSWIAEVISWVSGGPHELWYLSDLINCLQGVFIFIVIGCQPQVLSAVKRLWCFRKHRENGTAGTTNHHSSSSQGLPSMGDTVTNHSVTNNTTKSIPLETSC